jgi:prepilin-type N-terminal cleavage/methylation domain
MTKYRGFTLIELILVIVLLGVLAVTVAPRFFSASGYDQIAARDQLIQMLRQAQLQSMNNSAECQVVHFNNNQSWIPSDPSLCSVVATGEITAAFDIWGRPVSTSATTFTLSGESAVKVCIEAEGYIHAC